MKVIKRFVDKYTHETVEVGTNLKDLSEERMAELVAAGVIEEPKPKDSKPASKQKK